MVAGVYRITSRVIETLGRARHDAISIELRARRMIGRPQT